MIKYSLLYAHLKTATKASTKASLHDNIFFAGNVGGFVPTSVNTSPVVQQPPPQVVVVTNTQLGRQWQHPMRVTCPNCRENITTSVSSTTGTTAWILAAVMCFVG